MKAKLYAVETAASCRWYVTLDEQVDAAYWFRQYGDLTVLRLLEPSLSFGQASALLPVLQQELPAISALLPPKRASHGKAFPELPNARMIPSSTLIDSNTLTSRLFHLIQSAAKTCHLASCRPGQFRFHNVTFARWANQDNEVPFLSQDVYTRIVRAWEGRALLPEEAEQLVQTVHGKGVLDGCSPGLPKNRTSSVSWCSYIQLAWLQGDLAWASGLEAAERRSLPHFWKAERQYTCRRCGSGKDKLVWTSCPYCRTKCPYCSECLGMGRVRFCSPLIYGGKQSSVTSGAKLTGAGVTPEDKGSGTKGDWKLSEAQSAASAEAVRFLDRRRKNTADRQQDRFLIWAVTGAGKTEMIFPLIAHELARGGRVLIATPRRDVVLELAPRIAKAFAGVELAVLYGGSTDRWERGALTIATTHQLLRFTQAFDLVVIDELDAFPYHKNPVPLLLAAPPLRSMLAAHKLSAPLVKKLEASLKRGAQVFVFVPNIRSVEPLVHLLRQVLGPLHGGRRRCGTSGTAPPGC